MSLIFCVCSVFGNLFVVRTLQIFRTRALISQKQLTKIGTISICTGVVMSFSAANQLLPAIFLRLLPAFVTIPLLFLIERRRLNGLRELVPLLIDRWIMNLKLGAASMSSRERALQSLPADFQALMRPLFTTAKRGGREDHPLLPAFAALELKRVAFEAHSALARLENLREVLRKSDDFRRKSGQSVRQTAIQSAVMLLLYAPLLVFTIKRGGWHANSDLVLWSVLFTAAGIVSMALLSRKTSWRI